MISVIPTDSIWDEAVDAQHGIWTGVLDNMCARDYKGFWDNNRQMAQWVRHYDEWAVATDLTCHELGLRHTLESKTLRPPPPPFLSSNVSL